MIIKGPYGNITILPVKNEQQNRESREEELYRTLAKISYDIAAKELKEKGQRAKGEIDRTKAKI